MLQWIKSFFTSNEFMPHGHCYLWNPTILWMNVISDAVIFLSYAAIPIALAIFINKRKDLPFSWMFSLFSVFIIACGFTHLLSIINVWQPLYGLTASVKVITAVASVLTAALLFPLIPKALAIPSPTMLQKANDSLTKEIIERKRIEKEMAQTNRKLLEVNDELKRSLEDLNKTQQQLILQEKWLLSVV